MSKKANPTLIGIFVAGALALLIAGIVLFGSGKFMKNTRQYVLYFEGGIAGLKIGAPVTFRGVAIGEVKDIILYVESATLSMRLPVIIEIDRDCLKNVKGAILKPQKDNIILDLVNRGLRGKLKLQSIVTGMLAIDFDFYPEKPARLLGSESLAQDIDLPELPTIPSDIEQFQKILQDLPIENMIYKAIGALEGIERIVNSTEAFESLKSLSNSMKGIEEMITSFGQEFPQIRSDIESAADHLEHLMLDARTLVKNTDGRIDHVAGELEQTVREYKKLAQEAELLVNHIQEQVSPLSASAKTAIHQSQDTLTAWEKVMSKDSAMGYKLYDALNELSTAARSIRVFAEYLERHPEALIRGKEGGR